MARIQASFARLRSAAGSWRGDVHALDGFESPVTHESRPSAPVQELGVQIDVLRNHSLRAESGGRGPAAGGTVQLSGAGERVGQVGGSIPEVPGHTVIDDLGSRAGGGRD